MSITAEVKERGILFKDRLVRAILDGKKTQTRRVMTPQPPRVEDVHAKAGITFTIFTDHHTPGKFRVGGPVWAVRELMGVNDPTWACPYGKRGDRLWVREAWRTHERAGDCVDGVLFRADNAFVPIQNTMEAAATWVEANDNGKHGANWRPSIFMPRWASRITLEITRVRVERIADITEDDCRAEGASGGHDSIPGYPYSATPREHFRHLWDSVNAKRGFGIDANPWVWVIDFRRVR